jgi:hypothetical protein
MSDLATNFFAGAGRRSGLMRLQVVDVETGQPVPEVKVRAWVRTSPTDSSGVC